MASRSVDGELLSARQLAVAVMVCGLSWVGAEAGRMDWRWSVAAVPLGVLLGWLLLRRVNGQPLFQGVGGGVLAVVYGGWAVVLMSCVLRRVAQRIVHTGGSEANIGWILVLITLPLIWIGVGKAAAFFHLVEILWLIMALTLAVLLLLMVPKVNPEYLWDNSEDWKHSALAMMGVLSTGLFVLPYIYKVCPERGDRRRGLAWLAVLGLTGVVLTALTTGVFGRALADQLENPFFSAVGVLGKTARLEGLISALWLFPDLALAGLLAQTWGKKPRPAIAAAAAFVLALTRITDGISIDMVGMVTLVLVVLTALIPSRGKKIVVPF